MDQCAKPALNSVSGFSSSHLERVCGAQEQSSRNDPRLFRNARMICHGLLSPRCTWSMSAHSDSWLRLFKERRNYYCCDSPSEAGGSSALQLMRLGVPPLSHRSAECHSRSDGISPRRGCVDAVLLHPDIGNFQRRLCPRGTPGALNSAFCRISPGNWNGKTSVPWSQRRLCRGGPRRRVRGMPCTAGTARPWSRCSGRTRRPAWSHGTTCRRQVRICYSYKFSWKFQTNRYIIIIYIYL